jgi:hypothetical protein
MQVSIDIVDLISFCILLFGIAEWVQLLAM